MRRRRPLTTTAKAPSAKCPGAQLGACAASSSPSGTKRASCGLGCSRPRWARGRAWSPTRQARASACRGSGPQDWFALMGSGSGCPGAASTQLQAGGARWCRAGQLTGVTPWTAKQARRSRRWYDSTGPPSSAPPAGSSPFRMRPCMIDRSGIFRTVCQAPPALTSKVLRWALDPAKEEAGRHSAAAARKLATRTFLQLLVIAGPPGRCPEPDSGVSARRRPRGARTQAATSSRRRKPRPRPQWRGTPYSRGSCRVCRSGWRWCCGSRCRG